MQSQDECVARARMQTVSSCFLLFSNMQAVKLIRLNFSLSLSRTSGLLVAMGKERLPTWRVRGCMINCIERVGKRDNGRTLNKSFQSDIGVGVGNYTDRGRFLLGRKLLVFVERERKGIWDEWKVHHYLYNCSRNIYILRSDGRATDGWPGHGWSTDMDTTISPIPKII